MSNTVETRGQHDAARRQDDVAVVQRIYEAFARRDLPAIVALFHQDCTIYQSIRLPWGGHYHGHQGLGEFLGKLTAVIESAVTTDRYIDDEDGHVVEIGRTRGRVLASGRPFDVAETHFWTVEDGRVKALAAYIDTAAMRAALEL